ncbi:MAG: tRNA (N6-threonylcarbamoyladenosine(37)-N6)-methyltransferase TrmO [Actinobacteria bacterium]|nr:tRNA (N6-threonylcarbamoyladenosine(37)-N6)-methyltransferase TrmO [Actinomycetota bacterium]
MELKAIGVIRSPYRTMDEAPFQGRFSNEEAELCIFEEYAEGLKDVEASRYLILLYWGHLADRSVLQTVTPWGPEVRGVFACRSPSRPNPVEFCVVELLERKGNRLRVRGMDAVDGSAIVDIKPYSARIDSVPGAGIGWFEEKDGRWPPAGRGDEASAAGPGKEGDHGAVNVEGEGDAEVV